MSEDRVIYRLPDIELVPAQGTVVVDPRGWRWAYSGNWHWSRGLGWVPPCGPLLRRAGPFVPDLWDGEGE